METKTVLITGGSRGLGRTMAVALTKQGHRVAVTGRDNNKLQEVTQELNNGIAICADVANPTQTRAVIDRVRDDLGPVDVLINNAGIGGGSDGPQFLWETDPQDWWRVQETNIKGPLLYSHAVLPEMLQRNQGIIINVGSYIAIRPMARATAYAASKAALARLTDCLAEDLADTDIQVFCVSPGLVVTDMTRDLPFIKDIPADQFNQPADIAGLVSTLAMGGCGSLSGRFIHVNDNLHKMLENADRISREHLYQLRLDGLDGLIA